MHRLRMNEPIELTFRRFMTVAGISLAQAKEHFGQVCLAFQ